jgi:acetamidase/formamidase
MPDHRLDPARDSLHGDFRRDRPPALTIAPGETVRLSTLDVGWGLENHVDEVSPRPKWGPRDAEGDDGPALTGPIAVAGAEPGMTLEIHIERLVTGPWGWTYAGGPGHFNAALNRALGVDDAPATLMKWALHPAEGTAVNEHGHRVAMRPFFGIMGLAPGEAGAHSGWHPRATGGNMDCKELSEGSVLYLPVEAPGALFSCGDAHAAQGDGEVAGTAIECRMVEADLRFELWDNFPITTPHIRRRGDWITLGFGEDLDAAIAVAMNAMLDLIVRQHRVSRQDALSLASVAVDLRLTQLVNGVRGVHAVLPRGAIG